MSYFDDNEDSIVHGLNRRGRRTPQRLGPSVATPDDFDDVSAPDAKVHNIRNTPHFALEAEVYRRITALVQEYQGRISLVGALGILDLVKTELIENNKSS